MTRLVSVLGMQMGVPSTAVWLATASTAITLAAFLLCGPLVASPFGRMLVAVRDDEARLRFLCYEPVWPKLAAWTLSGVMAAVAGALYVPQVDIINPRLLSPELSIEIAVLVALRGRGTLSGAVISAGVISALKFW